MRRTGTARTIVPVTVTGVPWARWRSSICGAGRGCISAAKPPRSSHVAASGSRAMRGLQRRAIAARRPSRTVAMPSHPGEIHQWLAMRMPAAKAKAAKRSGARREAYRDRARSRRYCALSRVFRLCARGGFVVRGGASVVAMSLSPESCHRPSNAFEGDDGLQMECLWEQVYQCEGDGSIPGWLQRAAGHGRGLPDRRRRRRSAAWPMAARRWQTSAPRPARGGSTMTRSGRSAGGDFRKRRVSGGNAFGCGARMARAQIVSEIGGGGG